VIVPQLKKERRKKKGEKGKGKKKKEGGRKAMFPFPRCFLVAFLGTI